MTKKILLTGATGFLGSHLAKALLSAGHEVVALKRKSSSLSRIESISDELTLVDIDGLNYDALFAHHANIDAILHTATAYGRSNETVSEIFETNTVFPLKLLDAGSRAGIKVFINTDTILNKYLNQYALSKNQFLQWGKIVAKQKNIRFLNAKLEHFYGNNDTPTKFTAQVINSCLGNTPELKLTLGEQKRDFIHIEDVVSAYIILLNQSDSVEAFFAEYEVGTGISVSIRDFVTTVHQLTNSKTHLAFGSLPYRDGEVMNSEVNTDRLMALGWTCTFDITTGLQKVIEQERNSLYIL